MNWEFNDDTPIYLQIVEQIKARIAAGELKPGDRIPTVRDLAVEAGVNPNTMQKALTELERQGLLYSQRTSGRFVTDNMENKTRLKKELADQHMEQFISSMEKIGYSKQEVIAMLSEYVNK